MGRQIYVGAEQNEAWWTTKGCCLPRNQPLAPSWSAAAPIDQEQPYL
jgi:hypothetical protein